MSADPDTACFDGHRLYKTGAAALLLVFFAFAIGCGKKVETPPITPLFTTTISVSTNSVLIGEPFTVTVESVHPTGSVASIEPQEPGPFLLIHPVASSTLPEGAGLMTEYQFDCSVFSTGQYRLFTGTVSFALGDGTTRMEDLSGITVSVESSLTEETAGLTPDKPNENWPASRKRMLLGFLAVAVLAIVAGLLAARFLSRPRKSAPTPPPLLPHEKALIALRELRGKNFVEKGLFEPFFVELSGIFRIYLEDRFRLRAPELTTEEFLRAASESRELNMEQREQTRGFLLQSDLVKFARYEPDHPAMTAALASVEQFIRDTSPGQPAGESGIVTSTEAAP